MVPPTPGWVFPTWWNLTDEAGEITQNFQITDDSARDRGSVPSTRRVTRTCNASSSGPQSSGLCRHCTNVVCVLSPLRSVCRVVLNRVKLTVKINHQTYDNPLRLLRKDSVQTTHVPYYWMCNRFARSQSRNWGWLNLRVIGLHVAEQELKMTDLFCTIQNLEFLRLNKESAKYDWREPLRRKTKWNQ